MVSHQISLKKLFHIANIAFVLVATWTLLVVSINEAKAQKNDKKIVIGKCDCSNVCFSNEITDLQCGEHNLKFKSRGLPHNSHTLMKGIKATNQQYPREHAYEIKIPIDNKIAPKPSATEPGPIGIAINGVPLFDPGTQGPGSPHTLDKGELDECGGHAGRGDDYHYHIAPKCLIDDLGENYIEDQKKPIGFANDGFPILALGWFKKANDIESLLDNCRGTRDNNGDYFYNVKTTSKWDIFSCYSGKVKRISRDHWRARQDSSGADIVGAKASFHISSYRKLIFADAKCHIMEGKLTNQRVLTGDGDIGNVTLKNGAIFYCNPQCYAEFFEPTPKREYRGPILFYELITNSCPAGFSPKKLALFKPYTGPNLDKKVARDGKKKKKQKKEKKKQRP